MATIDQTKKALAIQPAQKDLRTLINEAALDLGRALPEHMRAERLVRIALTCIRMVPQLANCSPESFLGALFTAAQLGIEPIAGRAYLLPFYNSKNKPDGSWHKVLEAQFVMGYRGLAELFYRHEKAVMLNWGVVKKNDFFEYELGTESYLKHKPKEKIAQSMQGNFSEGRGDTIGFYVIADLGKAKSFHYMSLEECMEHGRKHSKTFDSKTKDFYDNSPWKTNRDAMCLKTVLIQLCKVLPLSFELQRAIEHDETSREYRKGVQDMLDAPSTTQWNEPAQVESTKDSDEPPMEKTSTEPDIPFGK